jgi:hypothetical protein
MVVIRCFTFINAKVYVLAILGVCYLLLLILHLLFFLDYKYKVDHQYPNHCKYKTMITNVQILYFVNFLHVDIHNAYCEHIQ